MTLSPVSERVSFLELVTGLEPAVFLFLPYKGSAVATGPH